MRRIVLPLATLATLVGLAHAQTSIGGKPWNPRDSVNYQTFQSGVRSNITAQSLIEIPSEADFQTYWSRSTGQPPSTAPRGVDWLRQKLIAVHLGTRPTGGYSVMVTNIERAGPVANVFALETKPAPRQVVDKSPTSPYALVTVDRIALPFRLSLSERSGANIGGGHVIVTSPGTVIVNPNDFEKPGGGGWRDPAHSVNWAHLQSGVHSRFTTSGFRVVSSLAEWQLLFGQMSAQAGAQTPDLAVDWLRERVVVVHLGRRSTGGYRIRVADVEKNGLTGVIRAIEEKPVPGGVSTQAVTSPYAVIKVPRNLASFKLDLSQERERGPGRTRVMGGGGGR
jgi:hypothetical protein